ncbi:family 20 glycosylhydrolase [Shewanella sp. WXL01]|uniref:family 20 glycosylhydrolase n=1 Tax=Shewanella sp. WXL01 TaxID=2709721 RepID=UPI0014386C5B|nr:family 20 glycosylhydrolase [Shewanella sp. WXL01]NKF50164.1 family 20 glycosylhydrolase [Shewanella sp. WXL01]
MRVLFALSGIAIALGLTACAEAPKPLSTTPTQSSSLSNNNIPWTQDSLNALASDLKVTYRVVTNVPEEACVKGSDIERCFIAEIDFTASKDITSANWHIYYSQMRPVLEVMSPEFEVKRIKGDLHQIAPTKAFTGFKAGQTKTLTLRGELWQLSETDAMPNYYIVASDDDNLMPAVIESTKLVTDAESKLELRPYVEPFTDAKRQYRRSATDNLVWQTPSTIFESNAATSVDVSATYGSILPTPAAQQIHQGERVDLRRGLALTPASFSQSHIAQSDVQPALHRLSQLGIAFTDSDQADDTNGSVPLVFKSLSDTQWPTEHVAGAYQLDISTEQILITAADPSGFSYALASLQSALDVKRLDIAQMTVSDVPRYGFRGMHVDVSRNFHSKATLKKLMEQMASYKLNKLHLHMGDDEGWRLQIDGLPELTDIGAKRCHDLSESKCLLPQLGSGPFSEASVNGYYSREDYIDILQFAAARHIEVIPSMDMPGHSRAAIKSMQARYNFYMAKGQEALANEYLLYDVNDTTVYSSVQYYDDNTLNVCMPSTYNFVSKVVDEIALMHKQAGVPLKTYHIGADETAGAWVESPICQRLIANTESLNSAEQLGPYFIERVAAMLVEKGIQPAGWSDGMGHTNPDNMPKSSQTNIWDVISHGGYKNAHKQANNGWLTILSNPEVLYFDFPYQADPKEHGYYWATRALDSKKLFSYMTGNLPANAEQWRDIENNPFAADDTLMVDESGKVTSKPLAKQAQFGGIQGQIWSETIRSQEQFEYMIFPRLLMLAERGWHKPQWEVPYQYQGAKYDQNTNYFDSTKRAQQAAQWQQIANHVGHKAMAQFDKFAINYRLPIPGANYQGGKLEMNIAFPGLTMQYLDANGDWQTYLEPVNVDKVQAVRSVSPDGKRVGRAVELTQ